MIHAVWRCLTEDGGIRGTGSSCDHPLRPWVGEEDVQFRIWERGSGVVG